MNFPFVGNLGPKSIRTRLVIWNSLAIVCLFLLAGLLLRSVINNALIASVDRELFFRTNRFMNDGPRGEHFPRNSAQGPQYDNGNGPADGSDQNDGNAAPPRQFDDPNANGAPDNPSAGNNRENRNRRQPAQRQTGPLPDEKKLTNVDDDGGNVNIDLRPKLFDRQGKPFAPFDKDSPVDKTVLLEALFKRTTLITYADYNGTRVRLLSRPFPATGELRGVIQAPYPMVQTERAWSDVNRAMLYMLPFVLLGAVGAAWGLTGRVLAPVRNIVTAADKLSAQDLDQRLPITGDDEFAQVSRSLNGMLERLQLSFKEQTDLVARLEVLIEKQKRFTADASHELKTPLTVIQANTSLALSSSPTMEDYRQSMEEIDGAARMMTTLVNDLLLLAKADNNLLTRQKSELVITDLINKALVDTQAGAEQFTFDNKIAPETIVIGNEVEVYRVLVNIFTNVGRYCPSGTTVIATAETSAGSVCLNIADNGPGIAAEDLKHLGERFYRVQDSRTRSEGGSGLGLAICKEIMRSHGGRLDIVSEVGKGTTMKLYFPEQ